MLEGFELLEEGLIYGILEGWDNKKIIINIKGKTKEYKLRENLISFLNNIKTKSFVRIYVKNDEAIHIEVLDEKLYKKYIKLFEDIKNIK